MVRQQRLRKEVLVRRSQFRLGEIIRRLEILGGYLVAYLNLDAVIKIIREEDEPKPALIKRFKLTDNQAEAILNMRLRALRKLEEMEIRREHDALSKEQRELNRLLKSPDDQWSRIADEIRAVRDQFSKKTEIGRRRTTFAEAPEIDIDFEQAQIEKEPITVVCSDKGWIRAMRGHLEDAGSLTYKEGDSGKFVFPAQTTDRIMLFSSSGKFFTLDGAKLPGGRGHGEPVRLICDLDAAEEIVALFVYAPGTKLLVASTEGDGFIAPEDECVANTRKGKQVLNVKAPVEACVCVVVPDEATHIATIGAKLANVNQTENCCASRMLLVTTINPSLRAWPPIWVS